jgi:hypothetical protein
MKKEYLSSAAKSFNEKSDTELIDLICDINPTPGEGVKAILDKRMKVSLQYLTRVIQTNNNNTEKYNTKLEKLTKYILLFTVIMALITCVSGYLAWKQYVYTELATRGERINQLATIQEGKKFCEENPDNINSGLYSLDGKLLPCAEVLNKK